MCWLSPGAAWRYVSSGQATEDENLLTRKVVIGLQSEGSCAYFEGLCKWAKLFTVTSLKYLFHVDRTSVHSDPRRAFAQNLTSILLPGRQWVNCIHR